MGSKEKKIAKLMDILNYTTKRKEKIRNYLKETKFLQSYSSLRANLYGLVNTKKHNLPFHGESTDKQSVEMTNRKKDDKKIGYIFDLSKLLNDFNVSPKKETKKVPRWKTHPPAITLDGINSKTKNLLISIGSSQSVSSRLKHLETILDHFIRHPSAKNFAVRKGAVGILLFIRKHTIDTPTFETIQQILATLGYVDPPCSRGIRILSIDGGGMRGIAVIRMLQKIEELSGKRICDLFDFICGVSTGAIITSCLIPPKNMTLDSIYNLYKDLSSRVFNQNAFWGTSMLLWSGAYYDTSLWEKFINEYVGKLTLLESTKDPRCPKVAIISTIVNQSKVAPFIFRNYAEPINRSSEYHGSYRHTMFEAVRASAAAPTIFEEFKIGGLLHQDGGLVVNNPTAVALHEAKCLWPDESISCVVSIGTGKYDPVLTVDEVIEPSKSSSSWKQIFTKILESATDTEAVHRTLNDLLPDDVYYRLNPHLSRVISMDEISKIKILVLEKDTKMYCRRNEDKFCDMVTKLTLPRPLLKKLKDYVNLMLKLFG